MAQPMSRAPLARAMRARAVPAIRARDARVTHMPIVHAFRAALPIREPRDANETPKRTVADPRRLLARKRRRREREALFR